MNSLEYILKKIIESDWAEKFKEMEEKEKLEQENKNKLYKGEDDKC